MMYKNEQILIVYKKHKQKNWEKFQENWLRYKKHFIQNYSSENLSVNYIVDTTNSSTMWNQNVEPECFLWRNCRTLAKFDLTDRLPSVSGREQNPRKSWAESWARRDWKNRKVAAGLEKKKKCTLHAPS